MSQQQNPRVTIVTNEELAELWRAWQQAKTMTGPRGRRATQAAQAELQGKFQRAITQAGKEEPATSLKMLNALDGLTYGGSKNRICQPSNEPALRRAIKKATAAIKRAERDKHRTTMPSACLAEA